MQLNAYKKISPIFGEIFKVIDCIILLTDSETHILPLTLCFSSVSLTRKKSLYVFILSQVCIFVNVSIKNKNY